MRLGTRRLRISPLGSDDLAAFVAYRREPEVARYQSWDTGYSLADGALLVAEQPTGELPAAGEWLQLALHATEDGRLVGDVAVHRLADRDDTFELGVTLAPAEQGRGFATEGLGAVVDALFARHGAREVIAECDPANTAVQALLERIGMRRIARDAAGDRYALRR